MNVLSLFDGMSCGQIAMERAGIKVDNYYASEIKKHGIKVTQHNYPGTVQLGDVRGVYSKDLPKIDLLIGGSPCQDFSMMNKKRLGLKGVKSSLFFEYVRILKEVKPKYFLLENVVMDGDGYGVICEMLKCEPVRINSKLVSAQNRDRLYWTNIPPFSKTLEGRILSNIKQPRDKGIKLEDVLSDGYTDRLKSLCLLEGYSRPHNINSQEKIYKRYKNGFCMIVFKDESLDWKKGIRFLNRREMEILQTVPEGYTDIVTVNEAASLLGDGWTIDVIVHILRGLK